MPCSVYPTNGRPAWVVYAYQRARAAETGPPCTNPRALGAAQLCVRGLQVPTQAPWEDLVPPTCQGPRRKRRAGACRRIK